MITIYFICNFEFRLCDKYNKRLDHPGGLLFLHTYVTLLWAFMSTGNNYLVLGMIHDFI